MSHHWALCQLNIWKSYSESLLKRSYFHDVFPVIWALTPRAVLERRWSFVKKGLFVWAGFFQGSKFLRGTSLWFSNPVFTAAAVLSPVNKKAKPQSPGSRTNTPSCWEGSPRAACAGWLRWLREPLSAFLLLRCHSWKASPRSHPRLPWKRTIDRSFLPARIWHPRKDASPKSYQRGLIYSKRLWTSW